MEHKQQRFSELKKGADFQCYLKYLSLELYKHLIGTEKFKNYYKSII